MGKKRLHLGVIFSTFDNTLQYEIWRGIAEFAGENDIHLTAYLGSYQTNDEDYSSHFDTCFETIRNNTSLNGVIMFSGFIAQNIGVEIFEKYAARLPKHLPLVSVSYVMPDAPSVLIDNIAGVYSAVEHLIKVHGKKKIAFVKGPDGHPEAEDRLLGYKKALEANGLSYDERYVLPGNFTQECGHEAVQTLLSKPELCVDAIAASDDETAVGILRELSDNNILVPADIAVTGFDDDRMAAAFIPSISTAKQDFNEIGRVSSEILLNLINDKPVTEITYVAPVYIPRQSCGCLEKESLKIKPGFESEEISADSLSTYISHRFITLFRSHIPEAQINKWVEILVDTITKKPFSKDDFLSVINELLIDYNRCSNEFLIWSNALNILTLGVELHHNEVDCAHTILSTLIFATTIVHGFRFKEVKIREFTENDERMNLRRVCSNIVSSFGIDFLAAELRNSLPEFSLNTAIIGLYQTPIKSDNPDADRTIDTLIGFDGDKLFNIKNNNFDPITLADYSSIANFDFESERRDLFFVPLFFKEDELGVLLIPYKPEIAVGVYETLRINISTAIKGAELLSKIQILSITDELTGLLNRRGFFHFVYSRIPHLKRDADLIPVVMFMDMDGLKAINDTYGHKEGDKAISAFAGILKQVLRGEDIVGRIGGDEFVVFSSVKAKENVKFVEQRIRTKIDEYNRENHHPYQVLASIGSVVLEHSSNKCFDDAMLSADSVLYEEKMAKKKQGLSRG
ncbi:MAG: GGDEF domain-containing protein [Lachnospiraceae bacterium]|nr:GGDEF domain-containing protein [Lachnospiraceae bacterium]